LAVLAAAPTVPRLEIELRDDRDDGWQVGLELHDLATIEDGLVTARRFEKAHVNDAVDLVGGRCRPDIGLMSFAASRLFGLVGIGFVAAERMGLASPVAFVLFDLLA